MPQVVALGLAAIFTAGVVTTAITVISYAIVIGAYYAYGTYAARRARAAAREDFNASLKDRLVMTATTDTPRSRVYGRVRNVDGIIYKGTHGAKKEFYTFVIALAGHEIDAVEQVYFADQALTLDGSGHVLEPPYRFVEKKSASIAGSSTAAGSQVLAHANPIVASIGVSQYTGNPDDLQPPPLVGVTYNAGTNTVSWSGGTTGLSTTISYQYEINTYNAKVTAYLGAAGQDLSPALIALGLTDITSAHKFQGIACLLVTLTYHQDSFPQGVPSMSARIRGAKVFDPRTGLTVWTRNPALIARDWAYYSGGGACVVGEVDEDILEDDANACDVTHAFQLDGAAWGTAPLYVCDMVAPGLVNPAETLQEIVTSMAGKYAWCGGRLRIKAGHFTAAVATIDETWLSGTEAIDIQSGLARQDLVNVFRPTIADEAQQYVVAPTQPIIAAAYVTSDGQELPREISLAAVADVVHAQHVCGCMLRDARQALTVKLPCNMKAYPVEVFDTVAVTLERFGWSAKLFEVLTWAWSPTGGVILTLKETAASIWDPLSDFSSSDEAPNTALPLPWVVPEPTGLTASSGTAPLSDGSIVTRVLLDWADTTSEAVRQSGHFEIQYTRFDTGTLPATDDWSRWPDVPGSVSQAVLTGLLTNMPYLFRVRAVNSIGIKSAWSVQLLHTVARPPSIIPDWTDIVGRPVLYRVVARGQSDLGALLNAGLYTGEGPTVIDLAPPGGVRSYAVHFIRRSDGAYLGTTHYDVWASTANADAMAAALNGQISDNIVMIRGEHEPQSNRLHPPLLAAMLRCGASSAIYGSPEFKYRSSYVLIGIPGCGAGNGYEAYQGTIDNDTNAWCDVAVSILGGNFTIGGTTGSPRSIRDYSYTGTLDATTDLTLIARGNCVVAGNLGQKIGGIAAWDSDIYTRDSAFGACFAQVTAVDVVHGSMFGLNSDPTTDQSYSSLDYSIFLNAGTLAAYESGAGISIGTYLAGDVLTVLYDGAQVRYLKNGVVLRTVVAPVNSTFFFDTSFLTPGAALRNMRFGILTDVSWQNIINVSVTTPQIAASAATAVSQATDSTQRSIGAAAAIDPICPLAVTLDGTEQSVIVTAELGIWIPTSGAGSASLRADVSVRRAGANFGTRQVAVDTPVLAGGVVQQLPTVSWRFTGLAAGSHTFGVKYDTISQAGVIASDVVRDAKVMVEVIKR